MIENGVITATEIFGVSFKVNLVPTNTTEYSHTRQMTPKYNVIHNTGNSNKGANDDMHAKFVKNDDYVLWHFTIDDDSITQHLPINRTGFHAGDGRYGEGNSYGIGYEICEDGDMEKAIANTYKLLYYLETEGYKLMIKPHQFFSGKYCPHWILDNWGMDLFVEKYEAFKTLMETPKHWAEDDYQYLNDNGITVHDRKFDVLVTRGEVISLMARILKATKG